MKSVSFSSDEVSLSNFKTFPRKAIRLVELSNQATSSGESLDQVSVDVFNRYRLLQDIDCRACLKHLAAGNCPDLLVRYSVLNTLIKSLYASDDSDGKDDNILTLEESIKLVEQATADLSTVAARDHNVLDLNILQQIMRCAEGVWTRFGWDGAAFKSVLQKFTEKCIVLIGERPSSKILISTAVRISSSALMEKILSNDQAEHFVTNLSRTQLLNAAGFTADAVAALYALYKLYPRTILSKAQEWISIAARGLSSNFTGTRREALELLSSFDHELITILGQPNDKARKDSEPLARIIAYKLGSIVQSASDDESLVIIKSVILVLSAAPADWSFTEFWTDALQVCLRSFPKQIHNVWQNILELNLTGISYYTVIFTPFAVLRNTNIPTSGANSNPSSPTKSGTARTGLDTSVYSMLLDVMNHCDIHSNEIWENLIAPLFKMLGPFKAYGTAAVWAYALSQKGMSLDETLVWSYLDVFNTISLHNYSRQDIDNLQSIWNSIAGVCTTRSSAMEMVKYHYRMLSNPPSDSGSSTISPTSSPTKESMPDISYKNKISLAFMMGSGLLKTLDHELTMKKAKNHVHSLLTLILLPVVIFLDKAQRADYLNRLISSNLSLQSQINSVMLSLLGTIDAGSENQPQKWSNCATVIRDYSAKISPQVLCETLLSFIPIMNKADENGWMEWSSMLRDADSQCQLQVIAKLPSRLPKMGISTVISLSNQDGAMSHKIRILKQSISSENVDMIREQAPSELSDNLAKALVQQKSLKAVQLAWKLLPTSRNFVVAKSLLSEIDKSPRSPELISFWNSTVTPNLSKLCPAFVSDQVVRKLHKEAPALVIPNYIIMKSEGKRPAKALLTPETTPKRPRRAILTGSIPVSLNTPPGSDALSEDPPSIGEDLCSSPPRGPSLASSGGAIPRTAQEKARMLKRILMGLKMDEAAQTMKRSEQLMIYNMLFKSCVSLKTHLAGTGEVKSEDEIEAAKQELSKTVETRNQLFKKEDEMRENGRRRRQTLEIESDSDEIDEEDLIDDHEYTPKIKMEV